MDDFKIPDWIAREPKSRRLRGIAASEIETAPEAKLKRKDVYLDGILAHAERLLKETGFVDLTVAQAQEKTLKSTLAFLYQEIAVGNMSQEQAVKLANALASKTITSGINLNIPIIFGIPEPTMVPKLVVAEQHQIDAAYEIIDGRELDDIRT
jgi:hypothetical protein